MWKAAAGTNVKVNDANNGDADEWETDPDFVNDVSEKEQRWGARTVEGSGHQASMKLDQLREEVVFVLVFFSILPCPKLFSFRRKVRLYTMALSCSLMPIMQIISSFDCRQCVVVGHWWTGAAAL